MLQIIQHPPDTDCLVNGLGEAVNQVRRVVYDLPGPGDRQGELPLLLEEQLGGVLLDQKGERVGDQDHEPLEVHQADSEPALAEEAQMRCHPLELITGVEEPLLEELQHGQRAEVGGVVHGSEVHSLQISLLGCLVLGYTVRHLEELFEDPEGEHHHDDRDDRHNPVVDDIEDKETPHHHDESIEGLLEDVVKGLVDDPLVSCQAEGDPRGGVLDEPKHIGVEELGEHLEVKRI